MITLFLILCYFILIFNIIVPAISEKMKRERHAYTNYKRLNKDFICVNDYLFTYKFTTSGIKAGIAVDDKNVPIHCSKIDKVNNETTNIIYCDQERSDIPQFTRLCYRAYSDLFFTT
ncbi:IMV membrane protein [Murmansk poxvirus]|uniref:IMV membrane protein n=1 Tax=Murmansk poxvirus TaxID=2025359 RepID=A0A223FMW6_9POXV|nr:IMV membrane protein [Murmansk poxvirus]AST09331.1 IMV membrane protein [Murmansk poxvirus]